MTTIAALAEQILRLDIVDRAHLSAALIGPDALIGSGGPERKVRCPSRDLGGEAVGVQCVRFEGHMGGHVGGGGEEWLVAMRCRLLGQGVCDRIGGHDGACVTSAAVPPADVTPPNARPPRARGVCFCGAPRKDHDASGFGGCKATGCAKYGKAPK